MDRTTARAATSAYSLQDHLAQIADEQVFNCAPVTAAAGTTLKVDMRGKRGFVAYFTGGAHTTQACDSAGATLAGSASKALANGTYVDAFSSFMLVTAGASNLIVDAF